MNIGQHPVPFALTQSPFRLRRDDLLLMPVDWVGDVELIIGISYSCSAQEIRTIRPIRKLR